MLQKNPIIDDLIVSTDDKKIVKVAKNLVQKFLSDQTISKR